VRPLLLGVIENSSSAPFAILLQLENIELEKGETFRNPHVFVLAYEPNP
jgi:hypothetical protein